MKEITSLTDLKQIELTIMKRVHNFCISNDINYYLTYGTLLGAIRHKGFIPWDDDIDIFMMRSDYEKFIRLFPLVQDSLNLTIVNHRTKPYYGRAMSKVIDNSTILIEPEFRFDDPIGVFIDIWPLDTVPNDKRERERLTSILKYYNRKLYGCISKDIKKDNIKKTILSIIYRYSKPNKIIDKIERLSKSYSDIDSDYVMCSTVAKRVLRRDYFGEPILVQFEDTQFYAPSKYDEVLTACFGDWKELPPPDKRVPHHVINVYWK